jgi:hypothetical protein
MTDRLPTSRVCAAALEAGHDPSVEHEEKRFRLVCSCGFKTPVSMKRKTAFLRITEHIYEAGHAALAIDPEVGSRRVAPDFTQFVRRAV